VYIDELLRAGLGEAERAEPGGRYRAHSRRDPRLRACEGTALVARTKWDGSGCSRVAQRGRPPAAGRRQRRPL
jgi:hypothetical protein